MARIAFCTTCGNRSQHLMKTLPVNLEAARGYADAVFVVVDYASQDGLGGMVRQLYSREIEAGRLVYYRFEATHAFRMAHAKNMAHRCGIREGGDILVNLDADNLIGEGFPAYINAKFRQADNEDEAIFIGPRGNHTGPGAVKGDRTRPGCSGRIICTRAAFMQAGGYDEFFTGWSPDDKDFARRLRALGYVRHGMAREYLTALHHNDHIRFRNYGENDPKSREQAAAQFTLEGRKKFSIVNKGNIGCGRVWRNWDYASPIEITPIASRVFGIGMHKTGTSSLVAAFRALGLDAAHWETAPWAKAIADELSSSGRSPTLESHYAVADLPIPLFYQELDRAYHGSKFILTVRDEEGWLKSVERHFERGPDTWGWNGDPFSHQMHMMLYGRDTFDAETMLNRYRRHNAEVRAYFAHRPEDLLVMDIPAGDGWPQLCAFLETKTPLTPFPIELVTPRADSQEADY